MCGVYVGVWFLCVCDVCDVCASVVCVWGCEVCVMYVAVWYVCGCLCGVWGCGL